MFELAPSKNPLSETNQNLYSAEPCKALQNEYNITFVRAKKNQTKTCKRTEKWQPGRQNRQESGKPKTDLLKNRPSVGFRFIENHSVSVSVLVSRRALMSTNTESCNQYTLSGDSLTMSTLRLSDFLPTSSPDSPSSFDSGLKASLCGYMTYEGSMTQPGCQETVTWIVMNRPIYITMSQVRSSVEPNQRLVES
jgi:hypothetical protein